MMYYLLAFLFLGLLYPVTMMFFTVESKSKNEPFYKQFFFLGIFGIALLIGIVISVAFSSATLATVLLLIYFALMIISWNVKDKRDKWEKTYAF